MFRSLRDPQDTTTFRLVDFATVRENRASFIGLGLVFVVLGCIAIFLPFIASLVTAMVLGWLMMIGGLLQSYHAVRSQRWAGSGWAVAAGVLQVVAGILVVAFPVIGKLMLTLVLAAYFAVEGIFKIIRAVQHRRMPAWGWLMFDGLLALALGVLILAHWPSTALWALGVIVGVNLLFEGSSMLLIGLSAGSVASART